MTFDGNDYNKNYAKIGANLDKDDVQRVLDTIKHYQLFIVILRYSIFSKAINIKFYYQWPSLVSMFTEF